MTASRRFLASYNYPELNSARYLFMAVTEHKMFLTRSGNVQPDMLSMLPRLPPTIDSVCKAAAAFLRLVCVTSQRSRAPWRSKHVAHIGKAILVERI